MSQDKAALFLDYWKLLVTEYIRPPVFPEPEYFFDKSIGRKHRFDWAFPAHKIAVEVDGGQFAVHGGRHSTDADREKLNIAASLGWRVFRFSPKQLTENPEACISLVLRTLQGATVTSDPLIISEQ